MTQYNPDKWLIVKLTATDTHTVHYRVFGTWSGGYLDGDSWKLNSGITAVTVDADGYYHFTGSSGSVYICHPRAYGSTGYGHSVLHSLIARRADSVTIEALSEETDFMTLDYK